MDVDSTFINEEVIDLIADHAGVGDRVADITERAMAGELDFAASLAERVALLKGSPESVIDEVRERITLTEGHPSSSPQSTTPAASSPSSPAASPRSSVPARRRSASPRSTRTDSRSIRAA